MFYQKSHDDYLLRLELGEDVHDILHRFAEKELITTATLTGLGAMNYAKIAHYPLSEKRYNAQEFTGEFEVANLMGNISRVGGKPFAHIHVTLGRADYSLFGGHLMQGTVSPTLEIHLHRFPFDTRRLPDEETGLKLLELKCQFK